MNMLKQYIVVALAMLPIVTLAQTTDTLTTTIERDVDVVNTYLPTISNPTKMQVAPIMDDTMSYKPSFKYSVLK